MEERGFVVEVNGCSTLDTQVGFSLGEHVQRNNKLGKALLCWLEGHEHFIVVLINDLYKLPTHSKRVAWQFTTKTIQISP